MNVLLMSLIAIVVGTLAGLLMSGRPGGLIAPVLLGGAGAVLAGSLGRALGWSGGPLGGPGLVVASGSYGAVDAADRKPDVRRLIDGLSQRARVAQLVNLGGRVLRLEGPALRPPPWYIWVSL